MASFNQFYFIGKIGMVFTLIFHLISTLVAEVSHGLFMMLYGIFGIMLSFGSGKTRRLERVRVRRK